jgi:hypothetical protein
MRFTMLTDLNQSEAHQQPVWAMLAANLHAMACTTIVEVLGQALVFRARNIDALGHNLARHL